MYFFFFLINHIISLVKPWRVQQTWPNLERSRKRAYTGDLHKDPNKKIKLQRKPYRSLNTSRSSPVAAAGGTAAGEEDGQTSLPTQRRYHRSQAPLWTSKAVRCKQQNPHLWGSSAGEEPRHSSEHGTAASRRKHRGRAPEPQPSSLATRSSAAPLWTKPAHAADQLQDASHLIPDRIRSQSTTGAADQGEQNTSATSL
jgi:hypothetical protein